MNVQKEKPQIAGWRMYKRQRYLVKKIVRKTGTSEAQAVRDAIELLAQSYGFLKT